MENNVYFKSEYGFHKDIEGGSVSVFEHSIHLFAISATTGDNFTFTPSTKKEFDQAFNKTVTRIKQLADVK